MPEIDLGPVTTPAAPGVSPEPGGPPAGADRLSSGPDRWRDRLGLPDRWRRPVPRPLVAAVSALAAGAAVALYLTGSADPAPPPPESVPILFPESWLDVQDGSWWAPDESDHPPAPRQDQAVAEHPAEAIAVLALQIYASELVGLPPGDYQVRASCGLARPAESLPDPVPVMVNVHDPPQLPQVSEEGVCDGQLWPVGDRLTIVDYQAIHVDYGLVVPPAVSDSDDPYYAFERADPLVVVSITPVD